MNRFGKIVVDAFDGFLRTCSSGGMPQKKVTDYSDTLKWAAELDYFDLAIAQAILNDRKETSQDLGHPLQLIADISEASTTANSLPNIARIARTGLEQWGWQDFDCGNSETFPTHSGYYIVRCHQPGETCEGHEVYPPGSWRDIAHIEVFIDGGEKQVTITDSAHSQEEDIVAYCRIPDERYIPIVDHSTGDTKGQSKLDL